MADRGRRYTLGDRATWAVKLRIHHYHVRVEQTRLYRAHALATLISTCLSVDT